MTTEEIRQLRARIEGGDLLDQQEQLFLLQQLWRANRRIREATRAGFPTLARASRGEANGSDAESPGSSPGRPTQALDR